MLEQMTSMHGVAFLLNTLGISHGAEHRSETLEGRKKSEVVQEFGSKARRFRSLKHNKLPCHLSMNLPFSVPTSDLTFPSLLKIVSDHILRWIPVAPIVVGRHLRRGLGKRWKAIVDPQEVCWKRNPTNGKISEN